MQDVKRSSEGEERPLDKKQLEQVETEAKTKPKIKPKKVKPKVKDPLAGVKYTLKRMEKCIFRIDKELYQLTTLKRQQKTIRDLFPSVYDLEVITSQTHVCPKDKKPLEKDCTFCSTKQRNICWKKAKKYRRLKILLKGLPYQREHLAELGFRDLIILCSHFKINTWRLPSKSKGELVVAIMKKQQEG